MMSIFKSIGKLFSSIFSKNKQTPITVVPSPVIVPPVVSPAAPSVSNEPVPYWTIGPIINKENYSKGMPSTPSKDNDGRLSFNFPQAPNHVNYLQYWDVSLAGKTKLKLTFTVTGDNVQFVPQEHPTYSPIVTLMIQRKGDDWSGVDEMNFYRWFSNSTAKLVVGDKMTLEVPLTAEAWKPVIDGSNQALFDEALENVDNVSILFGSKGGRGHGIYATGTSKFIIESFEII